MNEKNQVYLRQLMIKNFYKKPAIRVKEIHTRFPFAKREIDH